MRGEEAGACGESGAEEAARVVVDEAAVEVGMWEMASREDVLLSGEEEEALSQVGAAEGRHRLSSHSLW